MPLINPVFGLPASAVERLSDSEGKGRGRERKKEKKDGFVQEAAQPTQSPQPQELAETAPPVEQGQPLDTETVVKLLDEQVEPSVPLELRTHSASDAYQHVKKLSDSKKINKEI